MTTNQMDERRISQTARNVQDRQEVHDTWDAGGALIWASCAGDQASAERQLMAACEEYELPDGSKMGYETWDIRNGCSNASPTTDPVTGQQVNLTTDPIEALKHIAASKNNTLYVMRDLHLLLNAQQNFALRRYLLDLCMSNELNNADDDVVCVKSVAVVADTPIPHPDIKHFCEVIDMPMPGYDEMKEDVVDFVRESIRDDGQDVDLDCDDEVTENITNALLGLSAAEGERVLSRSLLKSGGFNSRLPLIIAENMANSFKKIPGLTFIPRTRVGSPDDIGSFDVFKEYMETVRMAFTRHALEEIELTPPSGGFMIGPGGTGKTKAGFIAGAMLDMDVIRLKLSDLLAGIVGESEKNARIAFAQIKAKKRCVLVLDELDKALGGRHENQSTDAGVGSNQLGEVLQNLQEISDDPDLQIFVIATVNRTEGLPEELTRPGRFDRCWGVGLPTPEGRAEIGQIHLRLKVKQMPADAIKAAGWKRFSSATDKFTGAEIEQTIKEGHLLAFGRAMRAADPDNLPKKEDCFPTLEDLLESAGEIKPKAVVNADEVEKTLTFIRENTRLVCSAAAETGGGTQRKRRRVNVDRDNPEAN